MLEVLLLEDLLLLVGPVRGVVLLLVDGHGVLQEAVVVEEAYATLPGVQHHRWDDRQHAHLLVFLLLTKPHHFHFQGIVGYKMYCMMETEIHARVCACVGVIFAALFDFCTGILTHSPTSHHVFCKVFRASERICTLEMIAIIITRHVKVHRSSICNKQHADRMLNPITNYNTIFTFSGMAHLVCSDSHLF